MVEKTGVMEEIFSQAGAFALYDVHDETRAVAYLGREIVAEPCCGGTPRTLREKGVEVVMAHAISERAEGNLRGLGVVTIKDAPLLSADALLAHLVSGTLQATAPTVDGAPAPQGACGGGGCGHCAGGAHHAEPAATAPCTSAACDNGCR